MKVAPVKPVNVAVQIPGIIMMSSANLAARDQAVADAAIKFFVEKTAKKGDAITVRNEHGRAVGAIIGSKVLRVLWKTSGKNLKLAGTEELIPGKKWRSVEAATKALLEASKDLVEPEMPREIISRSNTPNG